MKTRPAYRMILVLVLVGVVAALSGCTALQGATSQNGNLSQSSAIRDISPQEASALIQQNINSDQLVILDVRTQSEFQTEHLNGAINRDVNAGIFRDQMGKTMDKSKIYLVYCQSGTRSTTAAKIMQDLGYTQIYNMKGGIGKWKDAGYSTVVG
ncbi:rhodanese-like domain-containing protein [Methanosphaerula subterraneus]|jgi:rhodanese-related sulfurtransferase|uniref:rhodanese-like domain-containing protein n=1 Tax=Methanosphaerula subterraneus TaxID=3350244 RepID=UPI003F84E82F